MRMFKGGIPVIITVSTIIIGSAWIVLAQMSDQSDQSVIAQAQALAAQEPVAQKTIPLVTPQPTTPAGTYWSLQLRGQPPLPNLFFPDLTVYDVAPGVYIFDDRGVDYDALRAQQADQQQMNAALTSLEQEYGLDGPPTPPGGGGTNSGGGSQWSSQTYIPTTNDLWLEMIAVTNGAVALTIHPPWDEINGVHDLYYTTSPPISWQWLLRSQAGQTNLVVNNATNAQGFYRLAAADDLAATDSLGTNFWMMFPSMVVEHPAYPSLYISSPVGATGAVVFPGVSVNGPLVIVTNCGDVGLNGTYVLTNLTAQQQTDFENAGLDPGIHTGYVNGTNWVDFPFTYLDSALFGYDANSNSVEFLYYKPGTNLNGGPLDWQVAFDTNLPAPTTICEQVPFSRPFSVAAGAVTNVSLPSQFMTADYDVVETNGIHITASQPVSVYAFFNELNAGTAFTGYPMPLLGTNYCLMAYHGAHYSYEPSDFGIVATEDNTTVTVTPSPTANLVGGQSSTYTNILNQGQTYQTASSSFTGDVTGTRIVSDKPVAVFAGAYISYVPAGYQAGNPLMQEQVPVEQWGMQALSMGFAGRTNGDTYRVLAAYTNTQLTVTGTVVTIVGAGSPATVTKTNETVTVGLTNGVPFDIIVEGPVWFQANQPIRVAHFGNGNYFDIPPSVSGNPNEADPCEILLSPPGHWLITNVVFTLPDDDIAGAFDENFLNLIVFQAATNDTRVDGLQIVATNFVAIGASGYYGVRITIASSGVHTVTSSQPVGVEVYGWGNTDAYGYFGGIVK